MFVEGIVSDLRADKRTAEVRELMKSQRKSPSVVIDGRAREELIEEGEQISQMLQFGSVVPEREALPFFLISQHWFTKWQKYTGCFKVEDDDEEND